MLNIKILDSAKKHDLKESEIKFALENCICSKVKKNERGNEITLCIGILPTGQTCELIFYVNKYLEHVVFHAMTPARNDFVKQVKRGKKGK